MKKIFLMMAAAVCATMALTGCEDNTDPKAQVPTPTDFLNTPPTANYTYDLSKTPTVTLTCSQPDWGGVATIPNYAVELSLDPKFSQCPSQWVYTGAESTPLPFVELPNPQSSTTIELQARDIADAINGCRGYNKLDQLDEAGYTDYEGPVYIRLRAYFPNATESQNDLYSIISNIITLKSVIGYKTIRVPGFIYLVGAPEGWVGPTADQAEHYENWKLFEDDNAIGSQIYKATFDIPAGKFQFRFYKELTGWDDASVGSQEADNPVDIQFNADGVYSGACVNGKGSFNDPTWTGGEVTITVNLKAMTVEFKQVN